MALIWHEAQGLAVLLMVKAKPQEYFWSFPTFAVSANALRCKDNNLRISWGVHAFSTVNDFELQKAT